MPTEVAIEIKRSTRQKKRDARRQWLYKHDPVCIKARICTLNEEAGQVFWKRLKAELSIARLESDARKVEDLTVLYNRPFDFRYNYHKDGFRSVISNASNYPFSNDFITRNLTEYQMLMALKQYRLAKTQEPAPVFISQPGRLFPLKLIRYREFAVACFHRDAAWRPGSFVSKAALRHSLGIRDLSTALGSTDGPGYVSAYNSDINKYCCYGMFGVTYKGQVHRIAIGLGLNFTLDLVNKVRDVKSKSWVINLTPHLDDTRLDNFI